MSWKICCTIRCIMKKNNACLPLEYWESATTVLQCGNFSPTKTWYSRWMWPKKPNKKHSKIPFLHTCYGAKSVHKRRDELLTRNQKSEEMMKKNIANFWDPLSELQCTEHSISWTSHTQKNQIYFKLQHLNSILLSLIFLFNTSTSPFIHNKLCTPERGTSIFLMKKVSSRL